MTRLNNWLKLLCLFVWVLSLVLIFYGLNRPDQLTHIYFLDVGQGDSILVTSPYGRVLIDGGPDMSAIHQIDRYLPFWDRHLDDVILTHPHDDHVTGLLEVVRHYSVKKFWYNGVDYDTQVYKDLLAAVNAEHIPTQVTKLGDEFNLGPINFRTLYPFAERPVADDPNNTSVVTLLTEGSFQILFTGDAGFPIEEELVKRNLVPDVDVLKVGHHGSSTSSGQDLLSWSKPEVGVISDGRHNPYGHPSPDTVSRLQADKVHLFRTDQTGTVEIVTDGRLYEVHS